MTLRRWMHAIVQPSVSPELAAALKKRRQQVPVLWLLGKTGAGKTSVVQRLTGDSQAEIGNGFAPCTRSAAIYDYPNAQPVMRFLDTRGLGEAHYDPHEDLSACKNRSHAVLVLSRVDDTDQSLVLDALRTLGSASKSLPVLHIHTALHAVEDANSRQRAMQFNHQKLEESLKRSIANIDVDFTDPADGFDASDVGLEQLRQAIVDLVPELSRVLQHREASDTEQRIFLAQRSEVLGYASAAAAIDIMPAIGLVAVPSLQGKLLHSLARRYEIAWSTRMASEFLAALGTSFLYRYAVSLMTRELIKFVPVYGQTAGTAAAASISFASTYALGRAACMWFYKKQAGEALDPETLRKTFRQAFSEQRIAGLQASAETNKP